MRRSGNQASCAIACAHCKRPWMACSAALIGWRTVGHHFEHAPDPSPRDTRRCSEQASGRTARGSGRRHPTNGVPIRFPCERPVTPPRKSSRPCSLPALGADDRRITPPGADRLVAAFDGLELSGRTQPCRSCGLDKIARMRVPDWMPSIVNAVRIFLTLARSSCSGSGPRGRTARSPSCLRRSRSSCWPRCRMRPPRPPDLSVRLRLAASPRRSSDLRCCRKFVDLSSASLCARAGAGSDRRAVRSALEWTAVHDHRRSTSFRCSRRKTWMTYDTTLSTTRRSRSSWACFSAVLPSA